MKKLGFILVSLWFPSLVALASPSTFLGEVLGDKQACFLLKDMKSGKVVHHHGGKNCQLPVHPCSTFKLVLSAMAFDQGYFSSVDQTLKWDGTKHSRESLNRDQTPRSFMRYSVNWVGDGIIGALGLETVKSYLNKFGLGTYPKVKATRASEWSHGALALSPQQQTDFLERLWEGKLVSSRALEQVKSVSAIERSATRTLYGKTGTGCVDQGCISRPGRQLGWFVGVLERKDKKYVFALNYKTKKRVTGYAGPEAQKLMQAYFKRFYP